MFGLPDILPCIREITTRTEVTFNLLINPFKQRRCFFDNAIPTFPFSNPGVDRTSTPEEVDSSGDRQELGDERCFFCFLLAENKPKQQAFTTWSESSMTVRKKERRDQKVERAPL